MFFLQKSASSVNRLQAHLAKRKRIGWAIGFNSWTIELWSLCKIGFNDVSGMFNCWERRWIDVDGASHTFSVIFSIFSGVCTVFLGFHALVYRWEWQFLSLFSQDNEHKELTVLLFCQNPYAIFAHILQHYHDFQSNVAIFPSVVQAYTQPYSFGGRMKLIICQIKHKLSITIHEVSTSWKKC